MNAFTYTSGNTFLHRLGGEKKLLFFLFISILPFFNFSGHFSSWHIIHISLSIMLIVLSICAHIKIKNILLCAKGILFLLLFVVIFRSIKFSPLAFNKTGFVDAIIFSWSALISFYSAAIFFSCTKITALKNSIAKIFSKQFALVISMMLMFIPRFFDVWENSALAYKARGGKRGIKELQFLVLHVTEKMILIAGDTATAIAGRAGFILSV